MIILTQDNLPKYFTIANSENSWFQEPTNTFDFKSRESTTLLVTIGDSWTYGSDLNPSLRTEQVYGNKLSKMRNSDWLNLGLPAQGNFWIVDRLEELINIEHDLMYDNIVVVCVFTSVARFFATSQDQYLDYTAWFKKIKNNFSELFVMLNEECVRRINNLIKNSNIKLVLTTNFVDHLGFQNLSNKCIIADPWYMHMNTAKPITGKTYHCPYYERLSLSVEFGFVPREYIDEFKQWILTLDTAHERRLDEIGCVHPDHRGHLSWAQYLHEIIA